MVNGISAKYFSGLSLALSRSRFDSCLLYSIAIFIEGFENRKLIWGWVESIPEKNIYFTEDMTFLTFLQDHLDNAWRMAWRRFSILNSHVIGAFGFFPLFAFCHFFQPFYCLS